MGGSDSNSINNGYVNADLAPPDVLSDQRSHSSFSALDEEDLSSINTNNHNNNTTTTNHDDSPSTVPTSPTSVDQSVSSLKKAPSFTGSFASTQQQQQQQQPVSIIIVIKQKGKIKKKGGSR